MVAPFEGLLGDTSELRTIQFLLPVRSLKFNISELARETHISRQTMMRVVGKLLKWNVLKIAGKYSGANYYTLNEDSGFVKAFEDLDNCIIEQMLGEETLIKVAAQDAGRGLVSSVIGKSSSSGYIVGSAGEISRDGWLQLSRDVESDYFKGTSKSLRTDAVQGETYAAA